MFVLAKAKNMPKMGPKKDVESRERRVGVRWGGWVRGGGGGGRGME